MTPLPLHVAAPALLAVRHAPAHTAPQRTGAAGRDVLVEPATALPGRS